MTDGTRPRPQADGHLYRRIARNSAYLAGSTIATAAFTMLAVAVAARALTAREFGILVLLQSAALMLSVAMSFSTQQPIIRLGAAAQAEGDKDRLGALIARGLVLDTAASALAAAVALLLIGLFSDAVGLEQDNLLSARIFAASLLFTGYATSNGIFRLFDRFALLGLIQTLCAAALLLASGLLFALDAPFEAFVWAWAAYLVLNSQLQLWTSLTLARRARIKLRFKRGLFSGADSRTFLHYCWSTWTTSSAETLRLNGDSLLVGAIVSVEAAGLYTVAKQLAGVLRKFNSVYASALFPEISMQSAQGDVAGARQLKRRMMWIGLLVGGAAVAGAALIGEVLLALLFGPPFAAAYVALIILTAAAASQLISHTPTMYVQVYLGPTRLVPLYIAGVIVFLMAAPPMTIQWGIAGTAFAQLLSALALILLSHLALRRALVPRPPGRAA